MSNHEPTLLSKRAKWQDPATKVYIPGLLVLQQTRIKWEATVAGTAAPVIVPLAITTTQRAKGKPFLRLMPSASVFEFESEADRDMAVETLEGAKRTGGASTSAGSQVIAGLSKVERDTLLKEDADLVGLHAALVSGNAVSEEEFWGGVAQRRGSGATGGGGKGGTASAPHGMAKQRRGLSNAMKGVQHEVDGRHNTMTLNITKEMIAQVFAEKPHVLRSHQQHVPHDMTDNEFWSRYARHELAKEAKRKRRLAGGATDDLTDEHADMFDDRLTGADKRRVHHKVRRVDPTVNLAANFDDGLSSGFGIAHNASKEMGLPGGGSGMADDLLRDINRHGEVVLQGVDALQQQQQQHGADNRPAGPSHDAKSSKLAATSAADNDNDGPSAEDLRRVVERNGGALDDLRARRLEAVEVLNIQDPSRYFDRMQQPSAASASQDPGGAGASSSSSAAQAARRLGSLDPQRLANPPMNPGLAFKVLSDCSRGAQAGHDLDSYGQPTRPPGEVLDGAILGMIRAKVLAVNEILRHFWAALPGVAPPRVLKLDRLKTAMDSKGDEIESLQRATHGADRAYVRQLLRPARDALEAALTRYDEDVAARRPAALLL